MGVLVTRSQLYCLMTILGIKVYIIVVDVLSMSHDCAPGSPGLVEHVEAVKSSAQLLGVALGEFRLFVAEVAVSVLCLGVHEGCD